MKLPRKTNPVRTHRAVSLAIDEACLDDLRRLVEETLDFPAGARVTLSNSSPQHIRVHHEENR